MLRPPEDMREKRMIRALYVGALVLLFILFIAALNGFAHYKDTVAQRKAAFIARVEAQRLLSALKDSETGCRGYLLTKDTSYLEPYQLALHEVPQRINKLDSMLRDTVDLARIIALRSLAMQVLLTNRELVQRGMEPIADPTHSTSSRLDRSKAAMDRFRKLLGVLDNDLGNALLANAEEEKAGRWSAPSMLVLYTVLAMLATALLFNKLFGALRKTEVAEREVRRNVKRLAEEVRTREFAERTLRQVLDSSPSAIIAFGSKRDAHGAIVDFEYLLANDEAERMTGQAKGELLGKSLLAVTPAIATNGTLQEYIKVVETGAAQMAERRTGFHGSYEWLSVHMVKLHDGFVATFTDITERMQAEGLALEAGNLALADRISRTVAHEVRNPLTNVHLALEELNEELGDKREGAQPLLDIVERNIKRIGQLVTEMLESSRKRELNRVPSQVSDLVMEAMGRVADRLSLRNMRGETNVPKEPITVLVDPELILLAITNIAVNAIEAMAPEKGVLRLVARSTKDGVDIEVHDNGKGIAPENLGKLFEAFYTDRPGGMGLGLTAARSILSAHGILLEVESVVGKGTTFILHLPSELFV